MIEGQVELRDTPPAAASSSDHAGPLRSVIHGVPIGLALWAVLAVITERFV